LIVVALYLFTRERLPIETSSLFVLIVLVAGFELYPYEKGTVPLNARQFLSGFGNQALIAICSLIAIGKALEVTGALQSVAVAISKLWSTRPGIASLGTLLGVAVMSGFVNDTPIVVLMIPIMVGVAQTAKVPASSVMMPMGMATIIGGMATSIGTSTNLLVVNLAEGLGVPRIGMFDFTLPVLIVGGIGLLYVWLVVPHLLPVRQSMSVRKAVRQFRAVLFVREGGAAEGITLSQLLRLTSGRMRVESILRGETTMVAKLPTATIRAGDRLMVTDTAARLKEFEALTGTTLYNVDDPEHPIGGAHTLKMREQKLAEVVVIRDSPLFRRSVNELGLARLCGAVPLAVHYLHGQNEPVEDPAQVRMDAGDILLIQGAADVINTLRTQRGFVVLDVDQELVPSHRSRWALAVMALVVTATALGLAPIAVNALVGLGLMIALGCLSWRDAANSLPISIIMLIVTSLALGTALVGTGMAVWIAAGFVQLTSGLPPPVTLSAFLLVMSILTNIVSNNAAAVIGTPIAIAMGNQLGMDPMAFVLAVLFGANMSFATPFGYQTNLLVMSAGGYQFRDFLKVGVPLILIMWAGFSVVLPVIYA
jgi:di/tricarboxylate transporter